MRIFSILLVVTFKAQGMFPLLLGSVYRAAMPTHATPRDGPHTPGGPNLLDALKGFIVNPADLPWKWVKRLVTSGEKGKSRLTVKVYNLCRV